MENIKIREASEYDLTLLIEFEQEITQAVVRFLITILRKYSTLSTLW